MIRRTIHKTLWLADTIAKVSGEVTIVIETEAERNFIEFLCRDTVSRISHLMIRSVGDMRTVPKSRDFIIQDESFRYNDNGSSTWYIDQVYLTLKSSSGLELYWKL